MKKVMLVFLITATVGLLLLHTDCKLFSVYDMRGTWTISRVLRGNPDNITVTFEGSRTTGSVFVDDFLVGEYLFNYNDDLVFTLLSAFTETSDDIDFEKYNGAFDGEDLMLGTFWVYRDDAILNGTWTAIRLQEIL